MLSILIYLVSYVLVLMIHEIGHAFFVKIYGGEIKGIGFGEGKKVLTIRKFFIKKSLIFMGRIEWKLPAKLKTYHYLLIYMGGFLFNIFTGSLVWIFGDVQYANYYRNMILLSYLIGFCSLIPLKYSAYCISDGLAIMKILVNKYRRLS